CPQRGAPKRRAPRPAERLSPLLERGAERVGDVRLVVLVEPGVEWERKRSRAEVFGDGAQSRREAEPLPHVRLQVDAGEVARRLAPARLQVRDDVLPVAPGRECDDVDEPRALVAGVVPERKLEDPDVAQELAVAAGDERASGEDLVELLELGEA